MNIKNIVGLTEMLTAIGFKQSIGHKLLQYACFMPAEFVLREHWVRERDVLTCDISLERKADEYVCNYYDASFLKEIDTPDISMQGIDLKELDERMAETDWQLNDNGQSSFSISNEATWHREKKIEAIMTDLFHLSVTDEGKRFADSLKLKHWSNIPLHPLMGNLNALRSRFEVCQRFYFFNGQAISVEEAYRFLLNRWLEKKLHSKRKQVIDAGIEDNTDNGSSSANDSALLQKKKRTRVQKVKR